MNKVKLLKQKLHIYTVFLFFFSFKISDHVFLGKETRFRKLLHLDVLKKLGPRNFLLLNTVKPAKHLTALSPHCLHIKAPWVHFEIKKPEVPPGGLDDKMSSFQNII